MVGLGGLFGSAVMRTWILLLSLAGLPVSSWAGLTESEDALTAILFDENMENVSYNLRGDGFVDILFGPSVSDETYSHILNRLKTHPDIPGVLAGKGKGDFCPVK
jgi:hypothetical protein